MDTENNQEMFVPGLKPVAELLKESPQKIDLVLCRSDAKNRDVSEIAALCKKHSIQCKYVEKDILNKICLRNGVKEGAAVHQGVVARLTSFSFADLESELSRIAKAPLPLLLALDDVQDPGNVGTLVRTMYALGCAGLIVPNHNCVRLGPAALKASAGALERLPIIRVPHLGRALDTCEEYGLSIYGSGLDAQARNAMTTPIEMPAVLVVGNEARGLKSDIRKRCGTVLAIPQLRPFNSLNVAQAAAILIGLTAFFRQRQ